MVILKDLCTLVKKKVKVGYIDAWIERIWMWDTKNGLGFIKFKVKRKRDGSRNFLGVAKIPSTLIIVYFEFSSILCEGKEEQDLYI